MSNRYTSAEQPQKIAAIKRLLESGGYYDALKGLMKWMKDGTTKEETAQVDAIIENAIGNAIGDVMFGENGIPFAELYSQEYERARIFNLVALQLGKNFDNLDITGSLQDPLHKWGYKGRS